MNFIPLGSLSGSKKNTPLAILGTGPSFDLVDPEVYSESEIFALNHAIVKSYKYQNHWWFSNDHDNTFGNIHIKKRLLERITDYRPWRAITRQLFLPGKIGDLYWVDHRGKYQDPMEFRLPLPEGSTVIYYNAGKGNEHLQNFIYNGHSVLEAALTVATMMGYSPVVLIGCDMCFAENQRYYAHAFSWKPTPSKILKGKLDMSRRSVIKNRSRWLNDVRIFTTLWENPPFKRIDHKGIEIALKKASPLPSTSGSRNNRISSSSTSTAALSRSVDCRTA